MSLRGENNQEFPQFNSVPHIINIQNIYYKMMQLICVQLNNQRLIDLWFSQVYTFHLFKLGVNSSHPEINDCTSMLFTMLYHIIGKKYDIMRLKITTAPLYFPRCGSVSLQAPGSILLQPEDGGELPVCCKKRNPPQHPLLQLWAGAPSHRTLRRLPG